MQTQKLLTRLLWPVLGLGLLGLAVLQARASVSSSRPAPGGPVPAAAVNRTAAAEGRVVTYPGAEVSVGTDLAGTLVALPVLEKQTVRKGQLVAQLRSDDYRAELEEARARVAEIDADIKLAEFEVERARSLYEKSVGSKQALDKAERDLDTSRARRLTAAATVARLEAVLAKTRIVSPIDGVVVARLTESGETVKEGQRLVTIADLSRTRIEAEFDEFDAARVQLGANALVTAEGFDGRSWRGTVEEIPDAVAGRRLKPQDPGKPEDTRVLLVKIALNEPTPLKLGQRVEVSLSPAR
jgi:RND family efflux transporter MFP subunit